MSKDNFWTDELVNDCYRYLREKFYNPNKYGGDWRGITIEIGNFKQAHSPKPKEQPSQRIEISISEYSKYCEVEGEYRLTTSKCIPKEKLPLIKRCIEYVLNDDAKGYWKLVDELLPGAIKIHPNRSR